MSGESFLTRQLSQPLWGAGAAASPAEAFAALTGGEAGTVGVQHKHTNTGMDEESR